MSAHHEMDIYQRMSRNRLRLAAAFLSAGILIMGISGVGLYFIYRPAHATVNFWLVLVVFWLCFFVYAILRYALGGRRALKGLLTLPPWETDIKLRDALEGAKLASGLEDRIRLMEIPDEDINTFSISLPDGSFMLFATKGIADKLPERERAALMAHEIAHMQMGDTLVHTVMMKLAGRRALKSVFRDDGMGWGPLYLALIISFVFLFGIGIIGVVSGLSGPNLAPYTKYVWVVIGALFLIFAIVLPLVMNKLLQRFLDKEREYCADMQAVYFMRDPEAVYLALKDTAEDVRDVLLLPAAFDALLFNPVVNFTSYSPFRTQPSMAARMERLMEAFPQLAIRP
jgi:Zn-dependent protease with chaperone function